MTDREMKRFPNHKFGQAFTTIKCECLNYLPWLEKRYCLKFYNILFKVSQLLLSLLFFKESLLCSPEDSFL